MRSQVLSGRMTYAEAGVDVKEADESVARIWRIAQATMNGNVLHGVGPFCATISLSETGNLVASADGLGTKSRLHVLMDSFERAGHDLLNHSVNDILTSGASPLFFLDYIGTSSLSVEHKERLVSGLAEACQLVEGGCPLVGGETADMPGVYSEGDFDLVGFIVGFVIPDEAVDTTTITTGDVVLGLPSNGLHTNGYSLARRVFGVGVGGDAIEERARLDRYYPELDSSLGAALIASHLCYYNDLRPVLRMLKGIAHITGGGLPGNIPRILPEGIKCRLEGASWPTPPIFELIADRGNIAEDEMLRTFNMGLGIVFAVAADEVEEVRRAVPEAIIVGELVPQDDGERVVVI